MQQLNKSEVALKIPASPLRAFIPFAEAAKKKGTHIYHLNIGDPDIKMPQVMFEFLRNWDKNPVPYSHSQGEPDLIKSLLWYYNGLGFSFLKHENVQVTLGGSEGLLWTFLSVCDPGDEVIAFEPYYTNYNSYAEVARVKINGITTRIDDGFHLPSRAEIEKHINSKTRAILFSNPSNPTGTVYTRAELDMLADIAKQHNLYIVADEVYREFVYNGTKAISMLEYAQAMPEHILVVDSMSKRYSLCGARLGCIVSLNTELMSVFLKFGQARLSAGTIGQRMASTLNQVDESYFRDIVSEYGKRREVIINGLSAIPGVVCSKPEGAFYVMAKLPVDDAAEFTKWLLTDFSDKGETVMVSPAATNVGVV
jgi:aspartate aminotransferase